MRVVVLTLALSVGFVTGPAGAAPPSAASTPAVAGPGASGLGYLTPVIIASKSGDVTFLNLDVAAHDVVHDVVADGFGGPRRQPWCEAPKRENRDKSKESKKGKKKKSKKKDGGKDHHHHAHGIDCPVFWSRLAGTGKTTDLLGLENLKPGTSYTFFCTKHHNMKGTLIATD